MDKETNPSGILFSVNPYPDKASDNCCAVASGSLFEVRYIKELTKFVKRRLN